MNFVSSMAVGTGLLLATLTATADEEATVVRMGTLPGLQYDLTQFDVRPGAVVKLIFRNDDTMLHNLVIVKPGTRKKVVAAAAALGGQAAEKDYIPDSENVLWSIGVVDQGTSKVLQFTAPKVPGDYPYVCTYPGHGLIMFGNMRVTNDPGEPIKNVSPSTIPETVDLAGDGAFVKRTFMPHAGPASIAVRLPGGHAYCWDAGACRFRYAWRGGFTTTKYRKPDKLEGEIYYREEVDFPLYLGDEKPKKPEEIEFLGYRTDKAGIPEFEYRIDGVVVRERLEAHGNHLMRRFRASSDEGGPIVLWFHHDPKRANQIHAKGERQNGFIKFRGEGSVEFVITIAPDYDTGK